MKYKARFLIAGCAISAIIALSSSNVIAECYDASVCNSTALKEYNVETWMGANDVLGPDEEYVPGYETPWAS